MQEREKKRTEKAKSKKNITEKKKATKEKVSQHDETSETNGEITTAETKGKMKKEKTSQILREQ